VIPNAARLIRFTRLLTASVGPFETWVRCQAVIYSSQVSATLGRATENDVINAASRVVRDLNGSPTPRVDNDRSPTSEGRTVNSGAFATSTRR
jgi:hypothetical protein